MQNIVPIDPLKSNHAAVKWKKSLATAFRDPIVLLKYLALDSEEYIDQLDLNNAFKMLVPLSYAKKMKRGDWEDPLLKQVLPIVKENTKTLGYGADPVGDLSAEISSGLLQKYHGRVLLVTTGACPVHCRYCFRREFPYSDSIPNKKQWLNTLSKIKADKSIHEVILSGGDPLMLSDKRLKKMCVDLAGLKHIKTLRFHTRVPVFMPERITADLLEWMTQLEIQKVMVIHTNHANELDGNVANVLDSLKLAGVTLLNQSVLLKGINDKVEILTKLSHTLFSNQVMPYYLHQLDRASGTAHFEVGNESAIALINGLREQLPGYLVPKLVKEVSGKRSKQTIV